MIQKILDKYTDIDTKHLTIGEGGIFTKSTAVHTVLGSCVAVTFYCKKMQIGAVFHALLPRWNNHEKKEFGINRYKYVDSAINAICGRLRQKGLMERDIECKIFGGANGMMQGEIGAGEKNVKAAFETLMEHKMRITATDVGGKVGRKIVFITSTGEVYAKRLKG
ncbi:MAG: chemotaxis protein CheD [Thermodesulfobacteriota bacterium]|nr:chemotaxis protein CheD [Thermodesulfobacteriota bacterium]